VLATVLAYPPFDLAGLGLVMLAPVILAVERSSPRAAFVSVYVYSVTMALVIGRWLIHALSVEYGVPESAAWAFTVLLVAAYALVPASAAFVYARLRPRVSALLAPALFASLWILAEWLRAEPGALPWLLAAHALGFVPAAIQVADLSGVYGVGFLVVLVNAGIAVAASGRRLAPLVVPVGAGILALGYGAWHLTSARPTPEFRVGIIQASVPQADRFRPGSAPRNTEHHAALTRGLVSASQTDLVVWSETAVDQDLDVSPGLRAFLETLARDVDTPLVTGAPRSEGGRDTNSVVLVTPRQGLAESYAKQRLVPFSEYDPPLFAWLAPLLGPVTAGDPYQAGQEPVVFEQLDVSFAAPVCFEITYPHLMRRFRDAGAELVVNVSNDAWFGRSGYARMHLVHAVFRAVELRTWVVRGANTGISAIIDPSGRVQASLPIFEEGTLRAAVGRAGSPPLYARLGDLPILLFLLAIIPLSLSLLLPADN
jgi:apolipoprotein N-acyltransferase